MRSWAGFPGVWPFPWPYRQAFQKALGEVLPAPLIQTDAHLTTELSLTHQAARPDAGRTKLAKNGRPCPRGDSRIYGLGSGQSLSRMVIR
jgi:hypothetical protein